MKTIIALSGGMDSCALLALLLNKGEQVSCVRFSYGSKHGKHERKASEAIAEWFHVPLEDQDITPIFSAFRSDLLTSGGDIPEGRYNDESMRRTVVPCRNLIFASILSGLALSKGFDSVALGVHQGDHFIYPDCRPDFVLALQKTVLAATEDAVLIRTPFLQLAKRDIVKRGTELKAPFHLTRTCYKDQELSCGKCGSCQERLEAFQLLGIADPIPYQH